MTRPPLPRLHIAVLGVLTIVAFGSWFYGYGVLVEPIRLDTGWSESALASVYGVSLLATGVGGTIVGRLLDRRGSRSVFLAAAVVATTGLLVAASATDVVVFALAGVLGGGALGAAGYYNATQSVAARLVPAQRVRAITAITLWGAFASPIFLPLVGWLTATQGWRPTLRLLALASGASLLAATLVLPDVRPKAAVHVPMRRALAATMGNRPERRMLLAAAATGVATSVVLLYQVPAMTGAGLALTTASTLGGARGLAQLLGRLPLPRVIERLGAGRTLAAAYAAAALGAVILPFAGSIPVGLVYVAVAGIGIGALSAAEGIYAAEVLPDERLGTGLGVLNLLRGIGSSLGPVVAGILVGLGLQRSSVIVVAGLSALVGAALLPWRRGVDVSRP